MADPPQETQRQWSNLPPQILTNIRKHLESNLDILRSRSICKNWRNSIKPNPNHSILTPFLPLKISIPDLPFNAVPFHPPNTPLILVARSVLLLQPLPISSNSTRGWILTVEEFVQGKLRILYPLSGDHATSLPLNFPKCLNLLDYNVTELAKSYVFKYASDGENVRFIHRVVLCPDFTVMVLFGKGILAGVRLKEGNWGLVRDSMANSYSDVIRYKGTVCAVDHMGCLLRIDHKRMKVIKTVVVELPGVLTLRKTRLMEFEGELFLVDWPFFEFPRGVNVKVYGLCELHNQPRELNVRDWVVFGSQDCCFLLSLQDLACRGYAPRGDQALNPFSYNSKSPELSWYVASGDWSILSENCFYKYGVGRWLHDHQLFQGGSVNLPTGVCYFRSEDIGWSQSSNSNSGFIAGLLWPPPKWLLPDTYASSRDDEENEGSGSGDAKCLN